ncbi:hypothetical protein [Nocardioides dilutus]
MVMHFDLLWTGPSEGGCRYPHGGYYLVDHTGTRALKGSTDDRPLVLEIYRNLPETRLDWAA